MPASATHWWCEPEENLSKVLHFLCLRFLHIWWGSWHLPGRVVARMRENHTKSKGLSNHDLLKYNLTVYKLYSSLWELWPEVNAHGVYTLAGARVNTYTQTIPTNTPQTLSLSREQLFGLITDLQNIRARQDPSNHPLQWFPNFKKKKKSFAEQIPYGNLKYSAAIIEEDSRVKVSPLNHAQQMSIKPSQTGPKRAS